MRRLLLLLLWIGMCSISFCAYPHDLTLSSYFQSSTVTGKVVDETGTGMPGVNVVVKGTSTGTTTDAEGAYRISVTTDQLGGTLVFSFIGYATQEVTIGNQSQINVTLLPDVQSLQEVVVVGYGTQEKVNVTGAVGTVKSEDLIKVPSPNVSEVMIGKVPGLFSMQSQGVPGADYANLSIRGFGEPLVLVDGVQTSWTRIDPNEIESISVLKDASAAIYGARAGNGESARRG